MPGGGRAALDAVVARAGRESGTRRSIYRFIVEHPGLNLQELADAVGVNRTAIVYHVRRLMRDAFVSTQRQGPHVLHFPNTMSREQRVALSLLRIASVRAVASELQHDPEVSFTGLASKLGTSVRTVRRALRSLQGSGLLHVEAGVPAHAGKRTAHLHPELRLLLARWHPSDLPP